MKEHLSPYYLNFSGYPCFNVSDLDACRSIKVLPKTFSFDVQIVLISPLRMPKPYRKRKFAHTIVVKLVPQVSMKGPHCWGFVSFFCFCRVVMFLNTIILHFFFQGGVLDEIQHEISSASGWKF